MMDIPTKDKLTMREVYRRKYAPAQERPIESMDDLVGGWDEEQLRMMIRLVKSRVALLPKRLPRPSATHC